MDTLQAQLDNYLGFCQFQKRLDSKTPKAYRIDLTQFIRQNSINVNYTQHFGKTYCNVASGL